MQLHCGATTVARVWESVVAYHTRMRLTNDLDSKVHVATGPKQGSEGITVKLCTAKLCLENQNKTYRDQSYPKAFPQINKRESNFPCSLAQITPDNKQRFNTHSVSLARA